MLKFDAYFQEDVPMSTEEHYRIRQVKIYYYLEDDSMSVIEPVVENSGIPQGKLIKLLKEAGHGTQKEEIPEEELAEDVERENPIAVGGMANRCRNHGKRSGSSSKI